MKGLVVQAPSGLYLNSAREVDAQRELPNTTDMEIDDLPVQGEDDGDLDRPLTKKEKQMLRWMEAVQYMVPWYLETLCASKSLSTVDNLNNLPSLCAECEQDGKGIKVLFLLFTRMCNGCLQMNRYANLTF